eukprot:3786870-Prymnesium_polylepis.1
MATERMGQAGQAQHRASRCCPPTAPTASTSTHEPTGAARGVTEVRSVSACEAAAPRGPSGYRASKVDG